MTFRGGNGPTQSLDLKFPYPEDVDVYKLKTNGTKWKLYGSNGASYTEIDSREYQQTLKPYYTLPTTATYSKFKIEVSQVGDGSNALSVSDFILTNKYAQVLYPNLNQTVNTYSTVISGPTPMTSNIPTTGTETTAVNSVNQTGYVYYIQSNVNTNVSCAYFTFLPTADDYKLVGSTNGGVSWSNIIASNTLVSGNTSMFNSFRLLGRSTLTDLKIYDTSGNLVNNPGSVGGAYRGYESNTNGIYGEWLEITFDTPVSANVYEFSSDKMYPSSWYILGSQNRSTWYILDRQSNVYEASRISNPFQSNLVPYSIYRMVITSTFDGSTQVQSTRDKSAARIYDFGIYDNKGLQLVPRSNNTITSNTYQEMLPTSVLKPVTSIPVTSPFYDGYVYTSNKLDDVFFIDMYIPVSVYKIYLENTNGFKVYGSQLLNQPKTLVLQATPTESNTYTTTNNFPFRYFFFTDMSQYAIAKNPILFGLNGRLNPYMTLTSTSNAYGGYAQTPEFVEIRYPETTIDSYSFYTTRQPSRWTLHNYDDSGTRVLVDTVSNVYSSFNYYKSDLTPVVSTGLRLTVDELAPSKTPSTSMVINGFNAYLKNSPIVPYMTSNTLTISSVQPVISSQQGVFRFSSTVSDTYASRLFDYSDVSIFSYTTPKQSSLVLDDDTILTGDWVHVEIPNKTTLRYYTITPTKRKELTPKSWKLVGSMDGSDYNWTLLSTVSSFSETVATRFIPDVAKECRFFRLVFTASEVSLAEFALYDNARIIPKITGDVSIWETYKNRSGDQYGGAYRGSGDGEWIQIGFDPSLLVNPSNIFIESAQLPSNITVLTSNSSVDMSANVTVAAQVINFSNQKQITIPITRRDSRYYRIVANDVYSANEFSVSNIFVLNDRGERLYRFFNSGVPTDGVNASNVISDNGVFGGIFNGSKQPQYILANVQSAVLSNGYMFRSNTAKVWNVYASTDNSNWTLLDSRKNDTRRETFQIFYYQNQTGQPYKYFKAQINETFSTSDGSVSVSDFSILDSDQNKVFNRIVDSSGMTSNIQVGGQYEPVDKYLPGDGIYYGEYKTYQFSKPVIVSNVTLSYDDTTLIRDIVFLGCNTEKTWTTIPIVGGGIDAIKPGTYSFFKSNVFSPASDAFSPKAFCVMCSYEDIQNKRIPSLTFMFPFPTRITEIQMTFPTNDEVINGYLPIAQNINLLEIKFYGSYDNSTWTLLDTLTPSGAERTTYQTGVDDQSPFLYFKLEFTKFATSQSTNSYDAAIVKNIMFKYNGINLYTPSMFTIDGGDTQVVEQSPYLKHPFEFVSPVEYSNIAFVVRNTLSQDWHLKINNVQFQPNPFPNVRSNYFEYYDYKSTDVVSTSSEQSVVLKSSNKFFPVSYSFESNTANVWSFYTSDDGNAWTAVDTSVSGSKNRTIKSPLGAQFFKLSVEKVSNLVDGMVDISNVTVFSASSQIPPIPMNSNILIYETLLQDDSYAINNAQLRVNR